MRTTAAVLSSFLVVCLLGVEPAAAQEFGVKAGWTRVDAPDPDRTAPFLIDPHTGFTFGGFAILPIDDRLSAQVEALFSRRTIEMVNNPDVPSLADITSLFAPIHERLRADYLEVPVLLRVSTGGDGLVGHLLVGPALSINLAAELENRVLPSNSVPDLAAAVRDLDVGVVVGGALTLGSRIVVDGRYYIGLRGIRGDPTGSASRVPDVEWRSAGVSLGVIWR